MCQLLIAHTHAVCPICEDLEPLSSMQTVESCDDAGDNPVCEVCLGNHYRKCRDCAGYYDRYDCIATDDGIYCQSCHDDNFGTCERCEGSVLLDDLCSVETGGRCGTQQWCESCRDSSSFTCEYCSEVFSTNTDYGEDQNGNPVCYSCRENYFYCDSCGRTYHTDDYGEDGNCNGCTSSCSSDHVHDYGYKPYPWFYSDSDDKQCKISRKPSPGVCYLGVELETIVKSSADYDDEAGKIVDMLGDFVYLKQDSSLGDRGIEIVSHPATLEAHRKLWEDFHNDTPALVSWGNSACGLHVHASRDGLTDLQISKIVCFVNAEPNKAYVVNLAGRESSYAKLKPKRIGNGCNSQTDRREAVNLQNDETIEFRLFKGNLKRAGFLKCLEFVQAIIEYTQPASRSIADSLDYAKFIAWVTENSKRFPELHASNMRFVGNVSAESGK